MKVPLLLVSILGFSIAYSQDNVIDTLVEVGGYNIHFTILEGAGTPILFESGAGDDGAVWAPLAEHVHDVIGATVIYYDRSGFGQSQLNPNHTKDEDFGIVNGILELETGLEKLGFFDDLILVSHSYGGFYSTLLSARHPDKVLFNVRVDANLADQYTEDVFKKAMADNEVKKLKAEHLGMYYLGINFENTVRYMWDIEYPESVPAIDIVSPIQRHHTDDEWALLMETHDKFVNGASNRTGITAYGSGHYIYRDNPGLVLNSIVKAYVSTLTDDRKRLDILSKSVDKSIELFIESRKDFKR